MSKDEDPIGPLVRFQQEYPNAILYVDNDCWCMMDPDSEAVLGINGDELPEEFLTRILKHFGINAQRM